MINYYTVGECEECKTIIYFDVDNCCLTKRCCCHTIDPNILPEWVKEELGLDYE